MSTTFSERNTPLLGTDGIPDLSCGNELRQDERTGLYLIRSRQYWYDCFGMSKNQLFNKVLRMIVDWEGQELGVRRSLHEARTFCWRYTEPEVTDEWEAQPDRWAHLEEMDEFGNSEWLYTCLGSWLWTNHEVWDTYSFLTDYGYYPKTIIDFHSVIGMHTIMLSRLYPDVPLLYFHPVPRTYEFARDCLFPALNINCEVITDIKKLPSADLICSYEVFERDPHPVPLLDECLRRVENWLSMSNCWTVPARTHFQEYEIDGQWIDKYKVTKAYNQYVSKSVKKVARGWNSRPIIWQKKSQKFS